MKTKLLAFLFLFCGFAQTQTFFNMPPPRNQFLDQSGHPMSNGFVYTCNAGSVCPGTPQTSFNSATGAANPNPVPLDGGGSANIWLTNAFYKIAVANSANVVQYTVDNISGVNGLPSTTGTGGVVVLQTNPTLIGFTASGNISITGGLGITNIANLTLGTAMAFSGFTGTTLTSPSSGIWALQNTTGDMVFQIGASSGGVGTCAGLRSVVSNGATHAGEFQFQMCNGAPGANAAWEMVNVGAGTIPFSVNVNASNNSLFVNGLSQTIVGNLVKFLTPANEAILTGSVTNTDLAGTIIITNPATSNTYTFQNTYATAPHCVLSTNTDSTAVGAYWPVVNLTTLTVNVHVAPAANIVLQYICVGVN